MIMYKRKLRDDGSGRTQGTSDEEGTRKRRRAVLKSEVSSEDEPDFCRQQFSDSSRDDLPSPASIKYGQLYLDCIYALTDGDRSIWDMFDVLPSKEEYPDYYQFIKEPIDLQTIRQKYQDEMYSTLGDMEKDIFLMVKNAHAYNEPRSQIYKDATTIKRAISLRKAEIDKNLCGVKTSERLKVKGGVMSSADSDDNEDDAMSAQMPEGPTPGRKDDGTIRDGGDDVFVLYYNAILTYADETGRVLSEPFLRLPSKRTYPEYYDVIRKPLALLKIRAKVKAGHYDSLDGIEEDMNLVFSNAQTFNEDDSLLHKDAVVLQNLAFQKKMELAKIEAYQMEQQKKPRPKVLEEGTPQSTKKKREVDPKVLKKRMKHLCDTVMNFKDETGRVLCDMFMELPSAEDYPEYYKYIKHPIDLKMIEGNIKAGKYVREDLLMRDFEAMFLNAKHFNEEDSQVYKDAVVLEKLLKRTRKSLGPVYGESSGKQSSPVKTGKTVGSPSGGGRRLSGSSTPPNHCQALLNHIKNYRDSSDRLLCGIFEHLPSKTEYPDYYVLIKKPVDLSKIASNVETNKYGGLDDLEQDLLLMFDNACRYNEPDSQIYKDALTLQREMIQKKTELLGFQGDVAPDAPDTVQKLLKSLFEKVMTFKDDEGRCYSDSLQEVEVVPDVGEHEIKRTKIISLNIMTKFIEKGFYTRLDRLQDDMFAIFHKAREISRTDSEMYEDAVELHHYFINERDTMCKDGQKLVSQALGFGKRQFQLEVEEERKIKHETETLVEDDQRGDDRGKGPKKDDILVPDESEVIYLNEVTLDSGTYRLGDFVYVESREEKKPHIVLIERIWTDQEGNRGVYCCWFYRPEETFHLASRKFLEKEVFKSDHFGHISIDRILGKCYVLHVKDYFRMKPENSDEKDVYVCESKYQVKNKSFKKIKMWSCLSPHLKLAQRDTPLTPRRVSSVFASDHNKQANRGDKQSKVEIDDDELLEYEAELEGKNIRLESQIKGEIYFEQYTTATGCYKIGDSVYVRSDEEYPYMARIDKIWEDVNGAAWFHGNWYLRPEEAKHMPTRMFYEQEVFQSNIEDTNPMASIMGRCCILHFKDYMICRPTEIPERDVFVCESRYDEGDGHIRKLKGLKRPSLSGLVRDDEYYYFDEPYMPKKKPSPLLMTKPMVQNDMNESLDEARRHGMKKVREQAGFALFATEVSLMLRKNSADTPEDEVERVAKQEWKNLSGSKRAEYEARARAQGLESNEADDGSLLVYECGWRACDHQYEDIQDLMVHVMENGGHLVKENNEYPCHWLDCVRTKRGLLPFNTHSKLARHVREVHFKVAAKRILPSEKSRNYFPRHQAAEQPAFEPAVRYNEPQHFEERTPSRTSLSSSDSVHLAQKPFITRQPPPSIQLNAQIPMQPPPMLGFRMPPVQPPPMPPQQPAQPPPPQQQPQPPRIFIPRPHPVSTAPGEVGVPMQTMGQEPPQGVSLQQPLTIEQQQMLLQQVQRQQQEIQKLQLQIQQANSQQNMMAEPDSIFVPTQQSTTKLRHSEAYLRYIEGLRDNKQYLCNWNEMRQSTVRPQPQGQLPYHWLDSKTFGQGPTTDALWALRDHMLKDAVNISKIM